MWEVSTQCHQCHAISHVYGLVMLVMYQVAHLVSFGIIGFSYPHAREASRQFRNKMTEYMKSKINQCETKGKYKNIRDMHRG